MQNRFYGIKIVTIDEVFATFSSKYEAYKVLDYLRDKFGFNAGYVDVLLDAKSKIFESFEDFLKEKDKELDEIKKQISKLCYHKQDKTKNAYVKYDNYWWMLDTKTPIVSATIKNFMGGQTSLIDLSGYKIVEAKSWQDLDWSNTDLCSSAFNTGWIDRNGNFFGCDYRCHSEQARFVHGKTERELEQSGFVKVTYDSPYSRNIVAILGSTDDHKMIKPTRMQFYAMQELAVSNLDEIRYRIMLNAEDNVEFVD